jgi:hypothetical protein
MAASRLTPRRSARSRCRGSHRPAGVRRCFAPRQLRQAHAVETAHEGVTPIVIQRRLGHTTSASPRSTCRARHRHRPRPHARWPRPRRAREEPVLALPSVAAPRGFTWGPRAAGVHGLCRRVYRRRPSHVASTSLWMPSGARAERAHGRLEWCRGARRCCARQDPPRRAPWRAVSAEAFPPGRRCARPGVWAWPPGDLRKDRRGDPPAALPSRPRLPAPNGRAAGG